MNQELKNKLVTLKLEAETNMVFYRNRMNEAIEEGAGKFSVEFYQSKLNESKEYFKGVMDTLNIISKDQAK